MSQSHDECPQRNWSSIRHIQGNLAGIPTSKNIGDMHQTQKRDGRRDILITIKTKSEVKVKVTVTQKWYVTLGHPKMQPHTKFRIPTSKNIGDMHRTQSRTDGPTDGVITICLPKFLWGHKKFEWFILIFLNFAFWAIFHIFLPCVDSFNIFLFQIGTVSGSGTGPLDYGATGPVPDTEPRL